MATFSNVNIPVEYPRNILGTFGGNLNEFWRKNCKFSAWNVPGIFLECSNQNS